MTGDKKPTEYDVIETQDHLYFIIRAPYICGPVSFRFLSGNRMEATGSDGSTYRFANLSSHLQGSIMEKPISIITMQFGCPLISDKSSPQPALEILAKVPEAFYWHFNPTITRKEQLLLLPAGQFLKNYKRTIIGIRPASSMPGSNFALCKSFGIMMSMSPYVEWNRLSPLFIADKDLMNRETSGQKITHNVAEDVAKAFSQDAPDNSTTPMLKARSQIAIHIPAA